MKKKELELHKEKPITDLEKEIRDFQTRLKNLRFDLVAGKVKNIKEIKTIKKGIAQLLTLRKQKINL